MGEVIRDITDTRPNPGLVEMLESMLARAKAGEIRSAIAVTSAADCATGHCWNIDPRSWRQPILGELVFVQNEFLLKMSVDNESGLLRQVLE